MAETDSRENPRPELRPITLNAALNRGVRSLQIVEGQPLDDVSMKAYASGWALVEVNAEGMPIRAYRKKPRRYPN